MMPVKICGITSLANASMAVQYGACALGLIFYEHSPRFIHPDQASEWLGKISKHIKKVGVFVNEKIDVIQSISDQLCLDYIQLHGNESPEYCNELIVPVIKAFRVDKNVDNSVFDRYRVHAFLLDTFHKSKLGGTGECFNWESTVDISTEIPIILSGGINPDNILKAIKIVQPAALDVSSGVESSPGVKEKYKMKQLFEMLKNTQSNSNLFNNKISKTKL